MKELSIEEKAIAYDKAIEVIKKCETDKYGCVIGIKPSDIFPKLKESEDERIKEDLIQWINEFPDTIWRSHYKKDILAWLEKQGEQKHVKWSEEDERIINSIIHDIRTSQHYDTHSIGEYDKKVFWLKSIKGRYTWKPSDKQMQLLKEACDQHWEPDGLDPLYTLYQDLKKLKG